MCRQVVKMHQIEQTGKSKAFIDYEVRMVDGGGGEGGGTGRNNGL